MDCLKPQEFAMSLWSPVKDLYQPGDNFIVSPICVQTGLSMLLVGSKNSMSKELKKSLCIADNVGDKKWHAALSAFLKALKEFNSHSRFADTKESGEELIVSLANGIFLHKDVKIEENFKSTVHDVYGVDVQQVDFSTPGDSVKQINDFIQKQTEGREKDAFSVNEVVKDSHMMLVSVMKFQGKWLHTFPKDQTKESPFHLTGGKVKNVQMMSMVEQFRVLNEKTGPSKSQVVLIPFIDERFSLLAIIAESGLNVLEATLNDKEIKRMVKAMKETRISLQFPRFSIKSTINVGAILKTLGAPNVTASESADFSGITKEKLFLNQAIHKSIITVDEEGCGVHGPPSMQFGEDNSAPPKKLDLVFDRPFLACLWDSSNKSVMFMARVMEP